jgi:hypothetical protein
MGYLPQFKNDLFVSYRRVSNQTPEKWVDTFCKALHVKLLELVKDVVIWQDDQIQIAKWRPEIEQALDEAAIFLAIICQTYFQADECIKELDRFLARLKDSSKGSQRRILPIFKQPPESSQLPDEITQWQRYDFYQMEKSTHFREFSPNGDSASAFWERLEIVAQDIKRQLKELKEGYECHEALGKVFIGHVSPELDWERKRLRSDLQQRRFLIVPECEYFWSSSDIRDKITRDLDEARLSIHLVARTGSTDRKAADKAKLQLELAHQAMQRKGFPPPLVWIQPANDVDPSARDLIDYIKSDLANEGVDYWEGGLEEFKTQIYDKLRTVFPPTASSPVRQIALLVEEGDIAELGAINKLLVEKFHLDPKTIKFSGVSPKDAARLSRFLASCDQALIFWGNQPEEWVSDVLDHETLSALHGSHRLCVYAAGPVTPEKKIFQRLVARTILAGDDFNEADLRAFLKTGPCAT